MAESVASPSCIKLHMQRSYGRERGCLSQKSNFSMRESCRRHTRGRCKAIQLSMQKISKTNIAGVRNLKVHPLTRESSFACNCLGFLVDPEGTTASGLVPVGDQILLMTSIFLTYMAGVIPVQKSNFTSQMNVISNDVTPESPTSPGCISSTYIARQEVDKANLNYAWEVVKEKLLDSLNAIEHGGNMDYVVPEIKTDQEKHLLSLYAVSDGPKFRLLWASFQQLEKQVNNISSNADILERDDWLAVFSQLIEDFCQPVSMAWLFKELCLANSNPDQKIISLIIEKLKGEGTVLQNIIKSGKKDLYAELVYHLRFGFLRKGCCYDHSLFTLHADSVLEDLVVTLADGIAGNFLELISIDGTLSDEISSLGLVMCKLSTRSLQKLRNEVTLNQWLYQNVKAVVSMYEDRFDLCTFQSQYTEESSRDSQTRNQSWWKKLGIRKSKTVLSALRYIVITQVSISVKRTKELRALTGWRYYFSLFLELSDISMPLVKSVFRKISDAISFFLVCLIGRSLGLIYTGIRQSLRWK